MHIISLSLVFLVVLFEAKVMTIELKTEQNRLNLNYMLSQRFCAESEGKNAAAYFLNYRAISFERHGKDRTQEQQTIVVESVIH